MLRHQKFLGQIGSFEPFLALFVVRCDPEKTDTLREKNTEELRDDIAVEVGIFTSGVALPIHKKTGFQ